MAKVYKVQWEWFKRKDCSNYIISSWCKQKTDTVVTCIICEKDICCIRKGYAAVTQHAAAKVHKKNAVIKLANNQLLLKPRGSGTFSCSPICSSDGKKTSADTSTPSASVTKPPFSSFSHSNEITLFNPQEGCVKAELIWAMKSVACNMSPASCDDLKGIFSAMFPGAVPDGFSLGRTKLSYLITEALGPYFHQNLLDAVKNAPYTLLYDETTNYSNHKELQIAIRFWSEKNREVVIHHLKTVFLGHATAEDMKKKIRSVINEAELPIKKMLMLGSDGPNVNKKLWRLINNEVTEERGKSLINIGTCNLHVVHNAFSKGIEEYGNVVQELIIDVFNFFKKFPSRWEDFTEIQKNTSCEQKRFLKHVSVRWLTMGPAAERLLAQWPAIEDYFLNFIPSKQPQLMKSGRYMRIVRSLKYIDIKIELQFVIESVELFKSFLELLQMSAPLIHILYEELTTLLKKLAGRICKKDTKVNKPILDHLVPISEIYCSQSIKGMIEDLKSSDQTNIKHNMQKHYLAAFNYLQDKVLSESGEFLVNFQCLQPSEFKKSKSVKYVCNIAKALSFLDIDEMKVRDEWLILQSNFAIPADVKHKRIDHIWRNIIEEKNTVGIQRYPNVATLLKASFALSHGNSDVERGFSVSKFVLSEDKSAMSEKMLNARLTVKDGLKHFHNDISKVPITKNLLNLAYSASRSYKDYLEKQKTLRELKEKKKREKEKEKLKMELIKKELNEKKEKISDIESQVKTLLKESKEMKMSSDTLLKEGNDRLKRAIEKKDTVQIQVAQGMLRAAEDIRNKERDQEKKTDKLHNIVQKRKSTLIDFLSKNSKIKKQ